MELSISDLSKRLGVTPHTIERWLRQGRLPVVPKGKNYTFHSKELIKWAAKNNLGLVLSDKKKEDPLSGVLLSTSIQAGGVFFDIQGDEVQTVLSSAIEKMHCIPPKNKTDLYDRLVEREQALSTGIGKGIAIPHPREPLAYLKMPVVSVGFLAQPVDYNALDKKTVSVLFFILCPNLQQHLHLLSVLSFCLRNDSFAQFLKTAPNPDSLIEKVRLLEQTYSI